jgi:hypothetical protein
LKRLFIAAASGDWSISDLFGAFDHCRNANFHSNAMRRTLEIQQ